MEEVFLELFIFENFLQTEFNRDWCGYNVSNQTKDGFWLMPWEDVRESIDIKYIELHKKIIENKRWVK